MRPRPTTSSSVSASASPPSNRRRWLRVIGASWKRSKTRGKTRATSQVRVSHGQPTRQHPPSSPLSGERRPVVGTDRLRTALPYDAEDEAELREHFIDGSGAYADSLTVARLLRTLDRERAAP